MLQDWIDIDERRFSLFTFYDYVPDSAFAKIGKYAQRELNSSGPRIPSPQIQAPEPTETELLSSDDDTVYNSEPESECVSESDIIIAVMGPTGAGKSSFINRIVGEERTQVGHKLVSCTYKINIIRYRTQDDSQVVLIDTPGFNDTNLTDFAILVMITDWLAETYRRKVTLSGVLYFHRITDNRMTGSLQHNLDMFKSLVGFKAFSDVVLVTTMWDTVTDNLAKVNEQQLRTIYWREMLAKGSRLRRHDDTRESALGIISLFRASPHRTLLLVQHEMVTLNKALPDTTVGRRFIEWLSELLDRVKRKIFKRSRAKTLPPPGGSTGSLPGSLADLEVMREKVLVEDIEERFNLKRKWISNLRGPITSSPLTASPRSSISIESADSPPSPVLPLPSHSSISSYSSHDILQGTISWLRHVNTVTTAGQIPGLRELVGLALVVATTVDKLWSSEDSLVLLSQNTSWFISAIMHHASSHQMSDELISVVSSFTRDLGRVQSLVQEALKQPAAKRYMLTDKEKGIIETCNQAILHSTHMLQIRIALHNGQNMQLMNERVLSVLHTGFEAIEKKFAAMNHRLERRSVDEYTSPISTRSYVSRSYTQQSDDNMPPPSPVLCCLHSVNPGQRGITRRSTCP